MLLDLYDPLDDFIEVSLGPIVGLLSGKGGDADFVIEAVLKAMANRTSIHDALVRLNAERLLNDLTSASLEEVNKTRQHAITRLFKRLTVEEVVRAVSEALGNQVRFAREMGYVSREAIVIIDQHEREAWNAVNREYVVPINPRKKRNSRGFRFFSAMIKVGSIGFFAAFTHDGDGDGGTRRKGEIVEELLSQATEHVEIGLLLMDSGFYNSDVWRLLPSFAQDAMCPAPRNARVTRVILEHHRRLEYHYLPGAKPFSFADLELTLLVSPRPVEKRDIKFRQG